MDVLYHLPGTTTPDIRVRRGLLGKVSVLVDGSPAKRMRSLHMNYAIPQSDGSVVELQIRGGWTGLKAMANGVETAFQPIVPMYVMVLASAPLLLAFLGGLSGWAFGVIGAGINTWLARQSMRLPLKVGAMLGVTALSVVLYAGAVIAFTVATIPIPTLVAGTCINGIGDGSTVSEETTGSVDCGVPHDNEVVGTALYDRSGGYPGQDALQSFAEGPCLEAFSSYIGVEFRASSLDLLAVTPSELTWAKGDRQIGCVVVTGDGSKLSRTVKGSGR